MRSIEITIVLLMLYFLVFSQFGCAQNNNLINDDVKKPADTKTDTEILETTDKIDEKIPTNTVVDILIPELKTPIVNGLRVNAFSVKTQYKIGEPIKILTVIRNKTSSTIKLEMEQSTHTGFCLPMFRLTDEKGFTEVYPMLALGIPEFFKFSICSNTAYCIENDIQDFFNIEKPGKYKIQVIIPYKNNFANSNTIEFELIKSFYESLCHIVVVNL